MNLKRETESIMGLGYSLIFICLLAYGYLFLTKEEFFFQGLFTFIETIGILFPTLLLVFMIMVLFNFFIDKKVVERWFYHENFKAWFFIIIGGIISTGPLYLWYPILSDAVKKGVSFGLISAFIYSKAIKPALIPLMIVYFGLNFTILITILIIMGSLILGFITDFLMKNSSDI